MKKEASPWVCELQTFSIPMPRSRFHFACTYYIGNNEMLNDSLQELPSVFKVKTQLEVL